MTKYKWEVEEDKRKKKEAAEAEAERKKAEEEENQGWESGWENHVLTFKNKHSKNLNARLFS